MTITQSFLIVTAYTLLGAFTSGVLLSICDEADKIDQNLIRVFGTLFWPGVVAIIAFYVLIKPITLLGSWAGNLTLDRIDAFKMGRKIPKAKVVQK